MSISKIKIMKCNDCKRNFSVKVYDLIDGDKDYDLKKSLSLMNCLFLNALIADISILYLIH